MCVCMWMYMNVCMALWMRECMYWTREKYTSAQKSGRLFSRSAKEDRSIDRPLIRPRIVQAAWEPRMKKKKKKNTRDINLPSDHTHTRTKRRTRRGRTNRARKKKKRKKKRKLPSWTTPAFRTESSRAYPRVPRGPPVWIPVVDRDRAPRERSTRIFGNAVPIVDVTMIYYISVDRTQFLLLDLALSNPSTTVIWSETKCPKLRRVSLLLFVALLFKTNLLSDVSIYRSRVVDYSMNQENSLIYILLDNIIFLLYKKSINISVKNECSLRGKRKVIINHSK